MRMGPALPWKSSTISISVMPPELDAAGELRGKKETSATSPAVVACPFPTATTFPAGEMNCTTGRNVPPAPVPSNEA